MMRVPSLSAHSPSILPNSADASHSANTSTRFYNADLFLKNLKEWTTKGGADERRDEAGDRIFGAWLPSTNTLDLSGLNLKSLPACLHLLPKQTVLQVGADCLDLFPPLIRNRLTADEKRTGTYHFNAREDGWPESANNTASSIDRPTAQRFSALRGSSQHDDADARSTSLNSIRSENPVASHMEQEEQPSLKKGKALFFDRLFFLRNRFWKRQEPRKASVLNRVDGLDREPQDQTPGKYRQGAKVFRQLIPYKDRIKKSNVDLNTDIRNGKRPENQSVRLTMQRPEANHHLPQPYIANKARSERGRFTRQVSLQPAAARTMAATRSEAIRTEGAPKTPFMIQSPSGRYEAYQFPSKLPELGFDGLDSKKTVLFNKQREVYDDLRRLNPNQKAPLRAYFTKPGIVQDYAEEKYLDEPVRTSGECIIDHSPEMYFDRSSAALSNRLAPAESNCYEIYVDFANQALGGSWKKNEGFAQEEVAFIENVGLGTIAQYAKASNELTNHARKRHLAYGEVFLTRRGDGIPSPIIVEGCERVGRFKSYGREVQKLSPQELITKFEPLSTPAVTNWLAIAAPNYRRENFIPQDRREIERAWESQSNEVREKAFRDIFSAAHAGFSMAKDIAGEKRTLKIHTGQLGCGVFSNSLIISTAAQMLAAKVVGVDEIRFYHYRGPEQEKFKNIERIVSDCVQNVQKDAKTGDLVRSVLSALFNPGLAKESGVVL